MNPPRPMVILFGAGATRGAFDGRVLPPPVDSDFFDIAGRVRGRGTGRLATQVRRDVFDLYGRVTNIGLEQYYRDIETRLELSRFAKSRNRPKDWKERTRRLEELVRRVIVHTTCTLDEGTARPLPSVLHRTLLSDVRGGDSLITFNYDTVIEESMPGDAMLWTPRDGYGIEVSGITHAWTKRWLIAHGATKKTKAQIPLLKLHGSINWVLDKSSKVRLKPRPYVVRARSGKPVYDRIAVLPPGWHKRVDKNPYKRLWREARLRLEKCATLVVVGYSLPETDLIARALFLEASRARRARRSFVRELHVADVSEAARSRIVDVFVPALGPGGIVYRYDGLENLVTAWNPRDTEP